MLHVIAAKKFKGFRFIQKGFDPACFHQGRYGPKFCGFFGNQF